MIKINLIQAAQGDCIWIEYGEDADTLHRILIDGGTSGTYKHLKKRIESLTPDERHFELLVITHIDADHIAGILKIFEEDELGVTFADIWFNGYQHLGKTNVRGVMQAEKLTAYLTKPHISWNKAFNSKAVCVDRRKKFLPITLAGGMHLTLFSPTKKALSKLKPKWTKELQKAGLLADSRELTANILSEDDDQSNSVSKTSLVDVERLAEVPFKSDTSLTNGSSIAFLAEYDNKKMLFSGDAYATTLLQSLKKYLSDCEPLYLDLFKIPHHGSDGNISKQLLERIRCSKYLISANGAYHKHPDDVAIARIIKYGGHRSDIYFNYLSKYNEMWKNPLLEERYHYQAHYPEDDERGICISI